MPTSSFPTNVLAHRDGVPNVADRDSKTSVAIAEEMFALLGISTSSEDPGQVVGTAFEDAVCAYLDSEMTARQPDRGWQVTRKTVIADFEQYRHLADIERRIKQDRSGVLSVEIGRDYLIRPDITVGLQLQSMLILHAAVSCKLTIRSDRVQNIRHEGVILTRHRRGRQPHIVSVTLEPMATRIASIAHGTGEVDTIYHAALHELIAATKSVGTAVQKNTLDELVGQNRLADLRLLPEVLSLW